MVGWVIVQKLGRGRGGSNGRVAIIRLESVYFRGGRCGLYKAVG
jgi:hypothetical protein